MWVRALSLDEEASDALGVASAWALVARFERALIMARGPAGPLVSVVRHDLPNGPFTVRLADDAPRDFRVFEVPPRLDLGSATRWRVEMANRTDAVDPAELEWRLGILDVVADRAAGPPRGWETAISPSELRMLEAALAEGDARTAASVAARIAGLGPGLTPSGDDVLAGTLALLAWAEQAGLATDGAELRAAICAAATPNTTRLAGQLLAAAARGHVSEPPAGLLSAIFRREAAFPPDLAPVLAIGETSGADLLAGIRLAGRALVRQAQATAGLLA